MYSHMDGERTFSQLAAELKQVYGCNAASVFSIYAKHNPLKYNVGEMEKYWEHTRRFLEHLHVVLYAKDHQLSLHKIKPESYFFLTKICIDHAFTVTELIDVRNDREAKYSKDMANEIAHHVLPPYLTYRRQTLNCSFDSPPTGPGLISPNAIPPQIPSMPSMYPQTIPMPQFHPQTMPMPQFHPQMMPIQVPWQQAPIPQMTDPYTAMVTASASTMASTDTPRPLKRIRPTIVRRKPFCVRKGDEKESVSESLSMPTISDTDNVPLNFYSVYCSERANKINNTAETHHVPQIFPVPNRPPPPV